VANSEVIRELLIAIGVQLDADGLKKAQKAIDSVKAGVKGLGVEDKKVSQNAAAAARARAAASRADIANIKKTEAERAAAAKALKETEAQALRATKRENAELKKQERAARGVTGAFQDMSGAMQSLAKYAAAALVSVGAVGAVIVANTHNVAKNAAETERYARAVGATSAEIVGLHLAMRSVGADEKDAADILNTLADRAEDAKGGMKSFIDDFALAGVAVEDMANLRPAELLDLFADGISKVEDPTRRTAAVVRILGDDLGRKVLPLMLDGVGAFRAYKEQAIETGQVLDGPALAASRRYLTTTQDLRSETNGLRVIIGNALRPAVEYLAEAALKAARHMRKMVQSGIDKWGERVEKVMRRIAKFVERNAVFFALLAAGITATTVAIAGFIVSVAIVTALSSAFAALGTVIAAVTAAAAALGAVLGGGALLGAVAFLPLLAAGIASVLFYLAPFVIGLGLAVLAIDDLQTYLAGGESAIGAFLDAWTGTDTVLGGVIELFRTLGDVVLALGDFFGTLGHIIIEVMRPAFEWLVDIGVSSLGLVTDGFEMLGSAIMWLFDTVFGTKLSSATSSLEGLIALITGATSGLDVIGGYLGVAPQAQIPAAAGAAGGDRSMTQSNTYNIASTDPTAAAREVGSKQKTGMRAAADFFAGGIR